MMSKKQIAADLTNWFNNKGYYGIIIYQRPGFKTKIAMATENEMDWNLWHRFGTMPFTAQPSDKWSQAPMVDDARTLDEALRKMGCL